MSTVPGVPTGLGSAPGNTTAVITFTAGSNGGSAITNYKYSTDGTTYTALTTPQTTSPITIPGLTNYVWYTIYIKAVNAVGDSVASAGVTVMPSVIPYTPQSMGTSLKIWYDGKDPNETTVLPANGASITSWKNKASTSYNATATSTTAATYDLSGKALSFVLGKNYSTGYTANPGSETMFVVFKNPSPTHFNNTVMAGAKGARGFGAGATWTVANCIAALNNQVVWLANTPANSYTSNTTAIGTTTVASYGATTNASINGGAFYTKTGGTAFTANTTTYIGTDLVNPGGYYYSGYIMEILIYNTVLSTTQIAQIQGYLAWKWGIQASLPSTHPYSATVPGPPTSLVATSLNTAARIAFSAPTTGGYGFITNYKYSTDGGTTYTAVNPAQTTSPITIAGLTNGVSYTIYLKAVNFVGDGTASSAVSVVPSPTPPVVVYPTGVTPLAWIDASDSTTITATANAVTAISNKSSVVSNYPFNIKTGTVTTGVDTIGNLNVISFSAGSALASAASYARGTAGISVFSVYKAVTVPNSTNYLVYTTSTGGVIAYGSHNAVANTNAFSATYYNNTIRVATVTTNTPSLLNDVTMVAVVHSTTSANNIVTVHGTAYSLGTSTAASGTAVTTIAYQLNGHPTGSGEQQIAETIVCNTAVTVAQRQQIEGYLAWKWSTQALLPSIHPYAPLTAPTITSATASGTTATIVFTAPPATGTAITGYKYSTDGGNTYTSTGSTASTFTFAITSGASFAVTVKAINANIGDNGTPSTNVPNVPTNVSAASGNASATVSFSPPIFKGSSDILYYTVTSTPDSVTETGTSSPIVVTGLINQPYTFTVNATNSEGTSAESVASAAATPVTVPYVPIMLYATGGNAQATVYWSAPSANGGMPVTSYTLSVASSTATNNTITSISVPSPITVNATQYTVTGLTNNVSYTFVVKANNSVGSSDPSNASNGVIPSGTSALFRIQFRRGPSATWSTVNPILGQGELAIDTDTRNFKIGDATTAWTSLAYGGLTGPVGPDATTVTNATSNSLIVSDTVGNTIRAQNELLFSGGTTLVVSTISTTSVLFSTVSINALSTAQVNVSNLYTNTITSANDITITAPSVSLAGDLNVQNEFYSMYYDTVPDNVTAIKFTENTLATTGASLTRNWIDIALSYSGQYQIAVAGTTSNNGIYISQDYGVSWIPKNMGDFNACAISQSGKYMTAVGPATSIYISSDYGTTWSIKTVTATMVGVAMSESGSYQTATSSANTTWVSSDFGNTWNQSAVIVYGISTSQSGGDIAISASGQYQTINNNSNSVLISSDYGVSWLSINLPNLPPGFAIDNIAMSSSGKYQLASDGYSGSNPQGYISTDYGSTWIQIPGVGGMVSMSASGQYMYMNYRNYIVISSDYGSTWKSVSTNLTTGGGSLASSALSGSGQYYTVVRGSIPIYTGIKQYAYNSAVASTIGVGLVPAAYMLQLQADSAFKPGTTTWTTGSDARIKTNIVSADLGRCYSAIQALPLKYFGWDPAIYDSNVTQDRHVVGFIAQDVKSLFPKSVDIVDEYTIGNTSFTQFHTLNTDQIYTANIGAVKRLIQTVDAQQSTMEGFAAAYEAQQSTMQGGYPPF